MTDLGIRLRKTKMKYLCVKKKLNKMQLWWIKRRISLVYTALKPLFEAVTTINLSVLIQLDGKNIRKISQQCDMSQTQKKKW